MILLIFTGYLYVGDTSIKELRSGLLLEQRIPKHLGPYFLFHCFEAFNTGNILPYYFKSFYGLIYSRQVGIAVVLYDL